MSQSIYVENISFEATENDIRKLFSLAGRVTSVHMLNDSSSEQFTGCCFVRMSTPAEAKEAITLCDGTRLLDRIIQVSEARPYKGKSGQSAVEVEAPGQKKRTPRRGRGGRKKKTD